MTGRFQVTEQVGGSRTGAVYKAIDTQTSRPVAVKLIPGSVLISPALSARAEREFKQLLRVSSPKIAAVFDCAKTADGSLQVAMEWCEGESLDKRLQKGPLDFETSKSIVLQVGQALLEAQKAGLVHRDIAPKNILLTASGEVKVINFPVAKALNDKVSGTAWYLAPEQIQGKPIDQRTNTYNLAALFYHLATGEPPFVSATEEGVLEMHVSSPLLPPSQRKPSAGFPAELDRVISKAMDKSSSRRHLTMRLFLAETEGMKLPAVVAPAPVAAPHPSLAKTMMFGGNQADVAQMVADAKAAKMKVAPSTPSAPASSIPVHAPVPTASQPVPSPSIAPMPIAAPVSRPAASAAMASMPTIAVQSAPQPSPVAVAPSEPQMAVTPPPQAPASPAASTAVPQKAVPVVASVESEAMITPKPVQPQDQGKSPANKSGAAFRETLWFKKGDVEQLVADAKAKLNSQGKVAAEGTAELPEDVRPLEDRYVDDGSVTVEDRKKFSLRTGGTAVALPTAAASVPGQKIDEKELVGEIGTGRRAIILIVAAVIILALVVVFVMLTKGKSGEGEKSGAGENPSAAAVLAEKPALPVREDAAPVAAAKPAGGASPPDAMAMNAGIPSTPRPAASAKKVVDDAADSDPKAALKKKGGKRKAKPH